MNYCTECGGQLIEKILAHEGLVPYCPNCQVFRFPTFSTAVSAIVYDSKAEKILLIQQYGRADYILVAGYVMKGDHLEETLVREIEEELGLTVTACQFNASEYYAKNNVLMCNFACQVYSSEFTLNYEVDAAAWFTPEEAKKAIKSGSLAEKFLLGWLEK